MTIRSRHLTVGPERDFPFYVDVPRTISPGGWLLVMLFCALGFAALITPIPLLTGQAARWTSVVAFVAVPLIGLGIAAGRDWAALFPFPRWKDVWIGLAFVPVTVACSALAALFVLHQGVTAANPAMGMLTTLPPADLALFLASTLLQLLGEETITILPLLATLTLLQRGLNLPRSVAVFGAWMISAVIFAALHLPTYGWHVIQTFTIIGMARLILSLPFLITKSIWSSTVAHVANDWLLFAVIGGLMAFKAGGAI